MILSDFQMAYASFKATKVRSILTVTGITIGVASIVFIYALGNGLKESFFAGSKRSGADIVTIMPGALVKKNSSGKINGIDIAALLGASTLTEKDVASIKLLEGVEAASPIGILSGRVNTETVNDTSGVMVIASNSDIRTVLGAKIKFGNFFGQEDTNRNLVIIGSKAAQSLFLEESPIGRMLTFRGTEFVIKGVFDDFEKSSGNLLFNFNDSVFMPIETAKRITGGVVEIREIQAKLNNTNKTDDIVDEIKKTLIKNHSNQQDFTVYEPGEYAVLAGSLFSYITLFVTAIAGISLFVGGIGIMNIMFVSVTERTKEIGVRKALGATSRQILGQFMMESIILSAVGGILGIILAVGLGYFVSLRSNLSPEYTMPTVALAFTLSLVIGTIFGTAPAIKASRQDPIKSLRHH